MIFKANKYILDDAFSCTPALYIEKNKMESGQEFIKRINKKKIEKLERLRKKAETKKSKKKLRHQKQVLERKRIKETRETLIELLSGHHQQNDKYITALKVKDDDTNAWTAGDNSGGVRVPKKLRCVTQNNTIHNKRIQSNHLDTESSASDSNEDECVLSDLHLNNSSPSNSNLNRPSTNAVVSESRSSPPSNSQIKDDNNQNSNQEGIQKLSTIKGMMIHVKRSHDLELQRRLLPIYAEEQEIVEAINDNIVTIICGETGSGKTTQIPQFLYEAGYTSKGHLIGITEPRRIAAISMSKRVGDELNDWEVSSYQVRYQGNRTDNTKILFMTDGVLMRELQNDSVLSKYSVIIIDEAHERSIYTDVLIGYLSRICLARYNRGFPLKLVIMSATLRLDDFLQKRLFPKTEPVLINVKSRQYPVTTHFERNTPKDYLKAAYRTVCKIHTSLPPGGILVFLSGQREVLTLIRWLEKKFSQKNHPVQLCKKFDENLIDSEDDGDNEFDNHTSGSSSEGSASDDETLQRTQSDLICLPLFSLLPSNLQCRVFEPLSGSQMSRLCVVSTNVAETSLTIPNIRYVVDSGKEKRREYDPITGVSRFTVRWISQASAQQRSGRAGRISAGHAYRLYSSAMFEDFVRHSPPEILNKPIGQLVLLLKSMGFVNISKFPFPTMPDADQLLAAETTLLRLGALEYQKNFLTGITDLGHTLSYIPLLPMYSKMLVISNQHNLLPYMITLVASLSVREPLTLLTSIQAENGIETQQKMVEVLKKRQSFCDAGESRLFGDLSVLLSIIGAAQYDSSEKMLTTLGLRPKAFREIQKLKRQLTTILNQSESLDNKLPLDFKLTPPSQKQYRFLRQIITNCMQDSIAKRADLDSTLDFPRGSYKCQKLSEFVFIDSTSMLSKNRPDFVLYQEINEVFNKKCMQNLIEVEYSWIPERVRSILGKL